MSYSNDADHTYCMRLNLLSAIDVTEKFAPLLCPDGGRVVNVGSGAAPSFVAKCSVERQKMMCDEDTTRENLYAMISDAAKVSAQHTGDADATKAAFGATGLGEGASYGLSKALLATYGLIFGRENPKLKVNTCSPGFIETDLTRPFAVKMGKAPSEMGMQSVDKGAIAPCFLTLGDVPTTAGTSWFWGSDAQRSPFDTYRSPGDPPYTGGEAAASGQNMNDLLDKK